MYDHPYDDPRIPPKVFLEEVMHDPKVPLSMRMDAAGKLLDIYSRCYGEVSVVIKVQGLGIEATEPETQVRVSVSQDHEAGSSVVGSGQVGHA